MKILEEFKWFNRLNRLNNLAQIALAILLAIGVVHLASKNYIRKDFSANKTNTLSPETLAYLSKIDQPVEIYVIANELKEAPIKAFPKQFNLLLQLYIKAFQENKKGSLGCTFVHSFRQPQETLALKERYNLTEDYSIVVVGQQHFKVLNPNDFYTTNSTSQHFQGEAILTTALLNVTQEKPKTIYWTTGHGEYDYKNVHTDNGASLAHQSLLQNNVQVRPLVHCVKIPSDADMVVIVGPQVPFLDEEVKSLEEYLSVRNGHLLICLHPIYEHGLDSLLLHWGIVSDNRLLLDNGKDFLASNGDLIIRRLKPHAITNLLIKNNLGLLFGLTRPVRPDPGANEQQRKECMPFIYSSESSWAKKNYHTQKFDFDSGHDLRGPLPLGILAERGKRTEIGIQIPGGRLIVLGCSDWLTNGRFRLLGNRWLFLNSFKWCLESEETFSLPSHELEEYTLSLSQQSFLLLGVNFLLPPFVFFLLGIIVFFVRKE